MRGFEPGFRSYPDYLRAATEAIWNQRGAATTLRRFGHPGLVLRRAAGIDHGPEALRAEVSELAVALPSLRAVSEDILASGAPPVGFLGAQRLHLRGVHEGAGPYGTPTGRPVRLRAMAELYAKDNRISDGWAVIDSGALLRQLGLRVSDWARDRLSLSDPEAAPFRPEIDTPGPYTGQGNSNQWGEALAALLSQVMAGEHSEIPAQYDPCARLAYPGGVAGQGPGAAERFWLGLRAALPSGVFAIHHRIGAEDRLMPPRAALRWSLTGRHEGWGPFGRPTGAPLHVMGFTHAEFGPEGLRREWTLFDEAAIWMQIHRHTGAHAVRSRHRGPELAAV
ncbi:ester cyclase [Salipiger mucosus]|uniref:SnoaL-like domain-containing protein n=1 Tax=Salipiger mucosus DSM 16094 TaxID=1123237 RepID=S9QFI2_9RHOB|nr:ester cyclase [Salipiger mucosus]EPX78622.1 hypothetical protein Salmuc_04203 [Salipiger mucosus DSM 16094]